jgi:hypothetical protein
MSMDSQPVSTFPGLYTPSRFYGFATTDDFPADFGNSPVPMDSRPVLQIPRCWWVPSRFSRFLNVDGFSADFVDSSIYLWFPIPAGAAVTSHRIDLWLGRRR